MVPGGGAEIFDPSWLMVPAYDEFARRGIMLPGLLVNAFWGLAIDRKPLTQVLERLGASLPTGVFSNQQVHAHLHPGRDRLRIGP